MVFLENGGPKQGFSKFDLDVEYGAFGAIFETDPDLKQRFELTGDNCEGFVLKRTGNGVFQLTWRINYRGGPHPALAYLETVGRGGESAAQIVPLEQQRLFTEPRRNGAEDSGSLPVVQQSPRCK